MICTCTAKQNLNSSQKLNHYLMCNRHSEHIPLITRSPFLCSCACVLLGVPVPPSVTCNTSGVPQVIFGSTSGTRSSAPLEMITSLSWFMVSHGGIVILMASLIVLQSLFISLQPKQYSLIHIHYL